MKTDRDETINDLGDVVIGEDDLVGELPDLGVELVEDALLTIHRGISHTGGGTIVHILRERLRSSMRNELVRGSTASLSRRLRTRQNLL